jgi:manganese transport protein
MLFAQDKSRLGTLAAPRWQLILGWSTAAVIVGLNMKLLFDAVTGA